MPIHITMNDAATYGADYINRSVPEPRKTQIRAATKYNLLTKAFNASSVLLVAAAVSALFLAITSSFVFLSLGLFLRFTTERELDKYTAPYQPAAQPDQAPQQGAGAALWARLREGFQTALLRHALHQTTDVEKVANTFQNVGLPPVENWVRDEVTFLDFVAWKNTIAIPEAVVQVQREEAPVQQQQAPAQQQAPGMLAGLVGRVMGQQQQIVRQAADPE
ncbi:MAG: hypothetical protein K1X28_03820 [Parachlamydiales bacterium]|nr:hypothetical protein [Parachlamydiales bacterium]